MALVALALSAVAVPLLSSREDDSAPSVAGHIDLGRLTHRPASKKPLSVDTDDWECKPPNVCEDHQATRTHHGARPRRRIRRPSDGRSAKADLEPPDPSPDPPPAKVLQASAPPKRFVPVTKDRYRHLFPSSAKDAQQLHATSDREDREGTPGRAVVEGAASGADHTGPPRHVKKTSSKWWNEWCHFPQYGCPGGTPGGDSHN